MATKKSDSKAKDTDAAPAEEPKWDPFGPATAPVDPNVNPETGYERGSRMDALVKDYKEMGSR